MKSNFFALILIVLSSSASFAEIQLENACFGKKNLSFGRYVGFEYQNGVVNKYSQDGTVSVDPTKYNSMVEFLIERRVCLDKDLNRPMTAEHEVVLGRALGGKAVGNPCYQFSGVEYNRIPLFVFSENSVRIFNEEGRDKVFNGTPSEFLKLGQVCQRESQPSKEHQKLLEIAEGMGKETVPEQNAQDRVPALTGPQASR